MTTRRRESKSSRFRNSINFLQTGFALQFAAAIACVYVAVQSFTQATAVNTSSVILGVAFLFLAFVTGFGLTNNERSNNWLNIAIIAMAVFLVANS